MEIKKKSEEELGGALNQTEEQTTVSEANEPDTQLRFTQMKKPYQRLRGVKALIRSKMPSR